MRDNHALTDSQTKKDIKNAYNIYSQAFFAFKQKYLNKRPWVKSITYNRARGN